MSKQLSISIPDEMYAELKELKDELKGKHGKRKISKVCQKALEELLIEAKVNRLYRDKGREHGRNLSVLLTKDDRKYIAKVLGDTGSYRKWSQFDKIELLEEYFLSVREMDVNALFPKFIQIMDGEYDLHEWINEGETELSAEDKRGELAWSYREGIFEGIYEDCLKSMR